MAEEMKQTPKLELIKASQIDPKTAGWLWYPFSPYGKVTLVQGSHRGSGSESRKAECIECREIRKA